MKGFISKTLIFLGIFSLVMGAFTSFGTEVSFAEDLELIGRELGLVVTPESTRLFDLKNLNPGDTKEAKVDIKNNYTQGFELFMRTERLSPPPGEGDVDLFKQLIVTVYLGGEVLYSGPMINFATSNINLGRFAPGAEKELRAVVYLPGPETGNEFQGASVEVKWIFIAQADAPPPPPGPGPGPDPDPEPDPDPTPTPVTPTPAPTPTPEVPEEEEIVEEIPEGIPDVEEEVIEPIEELEEIEEEIPEGQPRMPKTGEIPSGIYYGLGTVLLGLGIGTGRKKKNR